MREKATIPTTSKAAFAIKQAEIKIGKCTYIVTTSYNGDKSRNIGASLARIISRDVSMFNGIPNIGA